MSGLGCNATRHQTNVPKQQGVPAAALRQPQSSVSLFAWLRFCACGDTQGSGQGGAGVQPTSLCASFNQRHDAERAPRPGMMGRDGMMGPGSMGRGVRNKTRGPPSVTPFIVAEQWVLLRRRATCSPDLTSLRATLFAGCTPRRTSFHPACASPLTALRSGIWASRGGLGWRGGRRGSLCLSL